MKRGFTLAEILISLAVISVLISIAMMITKSTARTNALMVKKAYNTVANTVYSMVQSESLYRTGHLNDTSATSRPVGDEYPDGNTKFCKVFASFVNTVDGEVDCSDNAAIPSFTTTNGIDWYLPPKAGTNGNFNTLIIAKLLDNTEFAGTIDGLLLAGSPGIIPTKKPGHKGGGSDNKQNTSGWDGGDYDIDPYIPPQELQEAGEKEIIDKGDPVQPGGNPLPIPDPEPEPEPNPEPEPGDEPANPDDNLENFRENIMIDVNGRKAPNCLEGEANCTNPDRFIIQVSATGKLYLPDDMTREYIRNSGSVVKQ